MLWLLISLYFKRHQAITNLGFRAAANADLTLGLGAVYSAGESLHTGNKAVFVSTYEGIGRLQSAAVSLPTVNGIPGLVRYFEDALNAMRGHVPTITQCEFCLNRVMIKAIYMMKNEVIEMIMYVLSPTLLMKLQNKSELGTAWIQQQVSEAFAKEEAIYIGSVEDFNAMPEEKANKVKELIYEHNWRKMYIYSKDEQEEAQKAMSHPLLNGRKITKR